MGAVTTNGAQESIPPARPDGPVFVVGSMRSGSTMLRLILDSHPRIAIGAETGFMGAVLATKRIPNWKYGDEWHRRIEWSDAELDDRIREFYDGMFARYAASRGKARWGEKTPFHTSHIAAMAELFPTSTFVGIVRHPGAVAMSLRKSFHYTFADALSYWSATNLDMVRAADGLGDRFAMCRYEDLVTSGEPVLRELMDTIGEEFSANLLHHHVVQRDQGAPRVVDGSTSTRDAIDATRADRWADDASESDRAELEATRGLAGFFGYAADDSAHRAPTDAVSGRRWSWTGADLARRREQFADRVDFEIRPPTLAIDADPEELARRLSQVEAALSRTRSRRAVQLVDAVRKAQRQRSWPDVKRVWHIARGKPG